MDLDVEYNNRARICAVGPSVWPKLGPERWFEEYSIVCTDSFDCKYDNVIGLGAGSLIRQPKTQDIVDSGQFQKLAYSSLAPYKFLVYKPVSVPPGMSRAQFIANDSFHARFENKREVREVFAGKLPFPTYVTIAFNELLGLTPRQAYQRFSEALGPAFVLQDELSSGGRGTYIVQSEADMQDSLDGFLRDRKGGTCVVSKFIKGIERSIQVFVSSTAVIPGPLQQQLTRTPELLNPEGRGGLLFCGGRLIRDVPEEVQSQVNAIVQVTASALKDAGYKGIFGLDFLLDEAGRVSVIELNARTTGLLPLLNEQPSALPLYLLHILELAGEEYRITSSRKTSEVGAGPESLLVLFNQYSHDAYFDKEITIGNYQFMGGRLVKLDDSPRWNPKADVLLQVCCLERLPAPFGHKLCNIFVREPAFDDEGKLTEDARQLVGALKKHIVARKA